MRVIPTVVKAYTCQLLRFRARIAPATINMNLNFHGVPNPSDLRLLPAALLTPNNHFQLPLKSSTISLSIVTIYYQLAIAFGSLIITLAFTQLQLPLA